MIKNLNNSRLAELNVDEKYYLFYQVWKELTEKKTMDSYQYKMMNSLSILDELNLVITRTLRGIYSTTHNVDECRKEAQEILKRDSIIKKKYRAIWQCLQKHLGHKSESETELRALQYQIVYCYNIISASYIEDLVSELESEIEARNSSAIIGETEMLISICASNGWSTSALYGLVDCLIDSKNTPTKWDTFKQNILSQEMEQLIVLIPISFKYRSSGISRTSMRDKVYELIRDMGIQIISGADVSAVYSVMDTSKMPQKDYMSVCVDAFDCYSAGYKAIDKCSDVLTVLSFYNYLEAWDCQDIACWVIDSAEKNAIELKSKQLFDSYKYLDSNQKIFRASQRVIQGNSSLSKKLQAAYAYANMGQLSGSQEEKFMNLWVALESLCRSDVYENIISNVLELVPPALCIRYIYRHFRNFIEDCRRCDVDLSFSTGSYSFADNRDRSEHAKDIIAILSDSALYHELESKCSVNELLLYRCQYMRRLATDPNEMINRIIQHKTMVKNHLGRLYRIRNDIAHSGMTSADSLTLYIEHLGNYLLVFVSEIVMCADTKQEGTPEIIFEMIKDNYADFESIVKSKDQADRDILKDVFSTGVIKLI